MCLDVGRMSRYRICIRLKSTFGSGSDWMRKKKLHLVRVFVFTRVQQIPICVRCERKIRFFCGSVNAALKALWAEGGQEDVDSCCNFT